MLKRPAVFFDRDNTLIVSDGYLGDPAGVVLVEGAADAVARARQYGFRVVTFSNQSGVAKGLFTEDAVRAVNARMSQLLQETNPTAIIDHHEYCPFHPEAELEQYRQDSFLRKPKPGMILAAAQKLGLDLSRSWVVGDAPRDIEAGKAAGCRTVLVRNPDLKASPAAEVPSQVKADFEVGSLLEAVELIARHSLCGSSGAGSAAAVPGLPCPEDKTVTSQQNTQGQASSSAAPPQVPVASRENVPAGTDRPAEHVPAPQQQADSRLERVLEQLLMELRRRDDAGEFSVSKLLAGIVQILALATLFLAYLRREDYSVLLTTLLVALMLQTFTIALLIMGRQK